MQSPSPALDGPAANVVGPDSGPTNGVPETFPVTPVDVRSISKSYRSVDALRDVSLTIKPGTVYALLGENGAGKTTLIRILTGFEKADRGDARVLGMDPARDAHRIRQSVGYVSDAPAMYEWMRVMEAGWFAAAFYDESFLLRYQQAIADFGLDASVKIGSLSKGGRAKVALALAIDHDPPLLIMDEPTSGLDPMVRRQFMESMVDRAAMGRTVLLSSHHIDEVARVADRVGIIHGGSLRFEASMQSLQDEARTVVITMDHSDAASPAIENELADVGLEPPIGYRREGRQHRWILRRIVDGLSDKIAATEGVQSVEVAPAGLEEIFVAVCGERS